MLSIFRIGLKPKVQVKRFKRSSKYLGKMSHDVIVPVRCHLNHDSYRMHLASFIHKLCATKLLTNQTQLSVLRVTVVTRGLAVIFSLIFLRR